MPVRWGEKRLRAVVDLGSVPFEEGAGGDDLLDAFLMFQRELTRYQHSGRTEAAGAWVLVGPG